MLKTAKELLNKIEGGRIVSSNDLNNHQIVEARANNKFYVDENGLGYAVLPWELKTARDVERRLPRA
jgi:hypothetical protein